jgi:hypothetical protein
MFRMLIAAVLTVAVVLPAEARKVSQTTGEEIPSAAPRVGRTTGEEIPSAFPWMLFPGGKGGSSGGDVHRARDAVSLRRVPFYSASGECYGRDRSGHWHWVDWRFC